MSFKSSLMLSFMVYFGSVVFGSAQNAPMGATAGLGPGNSFTVFVTFKEPVPNLGSLNCSFTLVGAPKPGQENFGKGFGCNGAFKKEDDTHYEGTVAIPANGIAEGDYKMDSMSVGLGSANRNYNSNEIPNPPTVSIRNHEHLKFSDIKSIEVK